VIVNDKNATMLCTGDLYAMRDNGFFTCFSELGLIVFEIDPKGCAARDGRVQV
jgi:hypothetical protein